MARGASGVAGLVALLSVAVSVPAQEIALPPPAALPAEVPEPELKRLVDDLGAPELSRREAATEAIETNRAIRLRHLERWLREPGLSPEQRTRLMGLARARFWSEPRAAMGVRRDGPFAGSRGVILTAITPGFPAAEVLRAGDRIETLDGYKLDEFEMFRYVIIAHDPGDEIPATVIRDGVTLNLKIKLGHYAALGLNLEENVLVEGWRLRSRPYASQAAAGSRIKLETPALTRPVNDATAMGLEADGGTIGVVAGGEARESRPPPPPLPTTLNRGGARMLGPQVAPARRGEAEVLRAQLETLVAARARSLEELTAVVTRLSDPALPGAIREELERRKASLLGQAEVYGQQIDRLQARLGRLGR